MTDQIVKNGIIMTNGAFSGWRSMFAPDGPGMIGTTGDEVYHIFDRRVSDLDRVSVRDSYCGQVVHSIVRITFDGEVMIKNNLAPGSPYSTGGRPSFRPL